ncbi:hypothetical protein C8A05DRAFT_36852 [Staphylotrichum tortipilum]|uniref:Uncharacterized protein n=1 Tax=Staphylotrichum tortipilum TaxID=2831512 RepID=A0AAN6RQY1_9PEZI|nr:hypothetical protein C8A05DRAFT_36852 [Staphylotrichum longicolle]
MLRTTRLPPGRRALLPRHLLTTTPSRSYIKPARTTIDGTSSITLTGDPEAIPSRARLITAPRAYPWTPTTRTLATLTGCSILAGSWCIWDEGRGDTRLGDEANKCETDDGAKTVARHRRGEKVNPDYVEYMKWVEGKKK